MCVMLLLGSFQCMPDQKVAALIRSIRAEPTPSEQELKAGPNGNISRAAWLPGMGTTPAVVSLACCSCCLLPSKPAVCC